jgi:hypothetical protein
MGFSDEATTNIPGVEYLQDLVLPGEEFEGEEIEAWNNAQGGKRELVGNEELRKEPKPPFDVKVVAVRKPSVDAFKQLKAQGGRHDALFTRKANGEETEFSGMSGTVVNVTERYEGGVLVADVQLRYLAKDPSDAV